MALKNFFLVVKSLREGGGLKNEEKTREKLTKKKKAQKYETLKVWGRGTWT